MNEPITLEAALAAVDEITKQTDAGRTDKLDTQLTVIRGALEAAKRLHEVLNHRPTPEAPSRIERMEKLAQEAATALERQTNVNLSMATRMEGLRDQLIEFDVEFTEAVKLIRDSHLASAGWTERRLLFLEKHKGRLV